ncbi:MAG TPA: M15 family metallopeptidase [Gemmatimonadaceae bacterium]|nr:M15 family metallopeptidase [Gemmatimonadaceae bacterium]
MGRHGDRRAVALFVLKSAELVGQADSHLCTAQEAAEFGAPVHADVVAPLRALRAAAAESGFQLTVLSGYRGFDRQLSIWNRKARGDLAVLDSDARPLDIAKLSQRDLAYAILRWSALPGASRHHWGTDIDIYDMAAKPPGHEVDLVPAEVEPGGMFAAMHAWLDERIASKTACGFFRPYDADRSGVAPERWHISYAPVSTECQRLLTTNVLRTTIENADMMLRDVVLTHLNDIFDRFVTNTNPAFA